MDKVLFFGFSMDFWKVWYRELFFIVSKIATCLGSIIGFFLVIFLLGSYCSLLKTAELLLVNHDIIDGHNDL